MKKILSEEGSEKSVIRKRVRMSMSFSSFLNLNPIHQVLLSFEFLQMMSFFHLHLESLV